MNTKETKYYCDKCRAKLPTYANAVKIQTRVDKGMAWSRLLVTIEHHHGVHNDGKTEKADLCKKCTLMLLGDALARVRQGERVSAGVDAIGMLKFNQPF